MDIVSWLRDGYNYLQETTDPRIKDWPMIESPVVPALLIIAYLLFIYLGPKWMANRKPMDIQNTLVVYNFSMVAFNIYIVKEYLLGGWLYEYTFRCQPVDYSTRPTALRLLLGGWLYEYTLGCQPVDYSRSPSALRMANAVWCFFIAKFIELLDTVFFILRKKNNQVTFLHVFHHGCLPLFWWWGVREVPGGFGSFHGLVNCIVHVVMYFYYGMTALGPKYQKYLWWKRYVTVFQLAQFFIVTIHNSQFLFFKNCNYPWKFVAFIQGFTTIVAALFLNFYIKTYRKSSTGSSKRKTGNGSIQNGHAHKNGYVNGHSGNSYLNGQTVLTRRPLRQR